MTAAIPSLPVPQDQPRAVIVGSGPNGLTAAACLAQAGWQVEVFERLASPGGASRSADVLGEGTIVDLGAAAHPFGVASPVFRELGLEDHGLEWLHSTYPMAHPLEKQPAALLHRNLENTAAELGEDGAAWRRVHGHLTRNIDDHLANILSPMLGWPRHPLRMAQFGALGALPATVVGSTLFREEAPRALFAGSAVHAILPPGNPFTTAFGSLFGALGMSRGWPVAKGGSQGIVDALLSSLRAAGGRVHTNVEVTDLRALPRADATILNLTPAQVLELGHTGIPPRIHRRFNRWKYGSAVFKVDYLLDGPVPWTDDRVGEATTAHVVGNTDELQTAEREAARGRLPERPFVMVGQQQAADPSRSAASGQHVLWTYAHVPNGYQETSQGQVAERIERQIERFAPGFQDRIIRRVQHSPAELQEWNSNLVGGDIAGGGMGGTQLLLRPGLTTDPYRLGVSGLYLASGATPPGAGVHGMAGAHAARAAIADFQSRTR